MRKTISCLECSGSPLFNGGGALARGQPFQIRRTPDAIEVTFHPTAIVTSEHLREAARMERCNASQLCIDDIWDFRACQICSHLTYREISALTFRIETLHQGTFHSHTALVVGTESQYGLARMYQILTSGLPFEVEVFRTLGEARGWIRQAEAKPLQRPA